MLDKPNIFNIPANCHFFESLFCWLGEKFPNQLSEVKLFLPNQRSCREFRQLFLSKKINAILPSVKAISDISYEDFFDFLPNPEAQAAIAELLQIKVISSVDYLFLLSSEIQKLSLFGHNLDFASAFKIATNLQTLFEDIEREEVDLGKLDEIDDSDLSKHRQLTLDFLKNFHVQVKNSLLKKNIFFPTSYQNFVIQKFTYLLEKYGSKSPLIIAGSTGSASFSKKLIKAVAKKNYVILHGVGAENYQSENHPQFFLNRLISFLEIEKKTIAQLTSEKLSLSSEDRQSLISQMMLPSAETLKWQEISQHLDVKKVAADLEKNFQLVEAKNEIEEAKIIALILTQALQQQRNCALITNNDKLANLVKLELERLALPFNDSRNLSIFNSKLVNFLLQILELPESDFNSHSLLTLLKNPLCFYSKNTEILADFEMKILRQDRLGLGLVGIAEKLKGEKILGEFFESFCGDIFASEQILKQVQDDSNCRYSPHCHPELVSGSVTHTNLASSALNLINIATNLSKKTWSQLLEAEPAQIDIFEFFEKLKLQNEITLDPQNILTTFKTLLAQLSYFEKSDADAPIQILSTIEARLLNFDLLIIGSLNEGDFPQIENENWLGKKIKKDLGIDRTLKKIGQNAFDFCNYLSNQSVTLTRCRTRNGEVLIESPFLLKFKTICQKLEINLDRGEKYFSLLKKINSPQIKKIQTPNPIPKIEFRPQKISITEISKLISDPYQIYAKKILQLRKLEKIDFEPSYAEFGSFVHKALEEFVKNPEATDFLKKSQKIFAEYFLSEESKLIWWPKFENIFSDFAKENEQFSDCVTHLEIPAKLSVGKMLISGKIDRVAISNQGFVEIIDYKTGQIPATKEVTSGTNPQLTVAALMLIEGLLAGGIKNCSSEKIEALTYWKLSASSASEIKRIFSKNEEIQILIAAAKSGLARLFEYFENEGNGYVATESKERNDYLHLARVEEWIK